MTTISENLKTIKDSTTAIKQAILDKGGTIEGNLTTYASAIANLPSGGGGGDVNPTASKNDVTFYDYDGTIRYSYTAREFLALSEMPPLPTQKGLICQGWNWSYEDAMEYVAEYGILDVGATYITDDGKTRLYIRIAAEGRMDLPLYFQQTIANGVTIDWGDGSATEALDGTGNVNTTHRYASIGDYCITLTVTSGCTLGLGHTSSYGVMGNINDNRNIYRSMLQNLEIGAGVTSIGIYAFYRCYTLSSVVIPNSVTSIGDRAFTYCYALSSAVIPNSVTSIGNEVFYNCRTLSSVVIPNSVYIIRSYTLADCYNLSSVVIPNSVTSTGSNAFSNYYALSSVVIPNSVTSIGDRAFTNCYGLAFCDFSHHTAVPTLSNTAAFTGVPSDCKIIVPDALYDKWIAATNWSTYASYIIKKTDWNKLQQ